MDKKSTNKPIYKSLSIKGKEIGNDMIIRFNGAGFWNVDSVNDMILPTAFNNSLAQRGPESNANGKIAFCWQHDLKTPIGKFTSLVPDNNNLKAEAVFDAIPLVKDVIIPQVNSGTLNNTSIGYRYTSNCVWMSPKSILEEYGDQMPQDKKQDLIDKYGALSDDKRIYVCKELKLHEISIVTIGVNDDTEIFGGKSQEEVSFLFDNTIDNIKNIIGGLGSNDQYTTLQELEKLVAIKDHFNGKHAKKPTLGNEDQAEKEDSKTFTLHLEPQVFNLNFD